MDPSTVVSVVSWPFIQLGGLAVVAVGIVQASVVQAAISTITVKNVVGAGTAVAGTTAVITGSGKFH